jgi:hypothetical protein
LRGSGEQEDNGGNRNILHDERTNTKKKRIVIVKVTGSTGGGKRKGTARRVSWTVFAEETNDRRELTVDLILGLQLYRQSGAARSEQHGS